MFKYLKFETKVKYKHKHFFVKFCYLRNFKHSWHSISKKQGILKVLIKLPLSKKKLKFNVKDSVTVSYMGSYEREK